VNKVKESISYCWLSHKINGEKPDVPSLIYIKKRQENEEKEMEPAPKKVRFLDE
jgi:hypothetical protein